jgi:hypothetical protein
MNGYPTGRPQYDFGASNLPPQSPNLNDRTEGFRQDGVANGFAQDAPRHNQVRDHARHKTWIGIFDQDKSLGNVLLNCNRLWA